MFGRGQQGWINHPDDLMPPDDNQRDVLQGVSFYRDAHKPAVEVEKQPAIRFPGESIAMAVSVLFEG